MVNYHSTEQLVFILMTQLQTLKATLICSFFIFFFLFFKSNCAPWGAGMNLEWLQITQIVLSDCHFKAVVFVTADTSVQSEWVL